MTVPYDPRYDPFDMELFQDPEDPFEPDLGDPFEAMPELSPCVPPVLHNDPAPQLLDQIELSAPIRQASFDPQMELMEKLENFIEAPFEVAPNQLTEPPVEPLPDTRVYGEQTVSQIPGILFYDSRLRYEHHPPVKTWRPKIGAGLQDDHSELAIGSQGESEQSLCPESGEAVSEAECRDCPKRDECECTREEDHEE